MHRVHQVYLSCSSTGLSQVLHLNVSSCGCCGIDGLGVRSRGGSPSALPVPLSFSAPLLPVVGPLLVGRLLSGFSSSAGAVAIDCLQYSPPGLGSSFLSLPFCGPELLSTFRRRTVMPLPTAVRSAAASSCCTSFLARLGTDPCHFPVWEGCRTFFLSFFFPPLPPSFHRCIRFCLIQAFCPL